MAYLTPEQLQQMNFASLGRGVRISNKASIYEPEKMHIGDHCRIDDFCVVSGRLEMGRNVYIGPFGLIAGGSPGIRMGDFTTLAYRVQIFSQSDDYSGETMTNPTVPAEFKNEIFAPVDIGRHSIIGAGSTIMPGADLAEGTSIGAASLVLRPTRAWGIYAGVPARRIRDRSRELLALEAKMLQAETGNGASS